jgi:hypothetical protein
MAPSGELAALKEILRQKIIQERQLREENKYLREKAADSERAPERLDVQRAGRGTDVERRAAELEKANAHLLRELAEAKQAEEALKTQLEYFATLGKQFSAALEKVKPRDERGTPGDKAKKKRFRGWFSFRRPRAGDTSPPHKNGAPGA